MALFPGSQFSKVKVLLKVSRVLERYNAPENFREFENEYLRTSLQALKTLRCSASFFGKFL